MSLWSGRLVPWGLKWGKGLALPNQRAITSTLCSERVNWFKVLDGFGVKGVRRLWLNFITDAYSD